jgi:hypothetical protein
LGTRQPHNNFTQMDLSRTQTRRASSRNLSQPHVPEKNHELDKDQSRIPMNQATRRPGAWRITGRNSIIYSFPIQPFVSFHFSTLLPPCLPLPMKTVV